MGMEHTGKVYDSFHEYDTDGYQSTGRIYVHSSVYLPNSEVDPLTGMLRSGARRIGRTQALRREADILDQEYTQLDAAIQSRQREKGIRMPLRYAILLIILLMVTMALILLVKEGNVVQRQRRTASVSQRIETLKAENDGYNAKIAEASDPATICYAAARNIGLIPADSTQAIHLTAMETRPSAPVNQVSAAADTLAPASQDTDVGQ